MLWNGPRMESAIDKLPKDYKIVLVLRDVEGLSAIRGVEEAPVDDLRQAGIRKQRERSVRDAGHALEDLEQRSGPGRAVGADDLHALGREPDRDRAAQALTRAGDDRGAAL